MPSTYDRFNLVSDFALAGDQARAIGELTEGSSAAIGRRCCWG